MAFATGTVKDHIDLLAALKTFLEGAGWVTQNYTAGTHFITKGIGGGSDNIFVGMQIYTDAPDNNYAWLLQGFAGYNGSLPFHSQPGAISSGTSGAASLPVLPLSKSPTNDTTFLKYWFIADSRCFKVIVKVSGTYQQMYGGWPLPYGLPSQWPNPNVIGGSNVTRTVSGAQIPYKFSDTSSLCTAFWSPKAPDSDTTSTTLLINEPGGSWRRILRQTSGSGNQIMMSGTHPFTESFVSNSYNGFDNIRPTIDGCWPLYPITIIDKAPVNMWGEFSGIKFLPGNGQVAENIESVGADDYLVIPNVFRTNNTSYCAYKIT